MELSFLERRKWSVLFLRFISQWKEFLNREAVEVIKIINRITSIFLDFHWLLYSMTRHCSNVFVLILYDFRFHFYALLCGRIYCCEQLRSLLNKLSAQRMGKFAWACKWIKMGFPLSICSWKKNKNYAIIFLELYYLTKDERNVGKVRSQATNCLRYNFHPKFSDCYY